MGKDVVNDDVVNRYRVTPIIVDVCQKEPKPSFRQKLKAEVKKIF